MTTKEQTLTIEDLEAQVQRFKEALGKANGEAQTLTVRVLGQAEQIKALMTSLHHVLAEHSTMAWANPQLYRECKDAMGERVG